MARATVTRARGSSMELAPAMAIPSGRLWRKIPTIISREARSSSRCFSWWGKRRSRTDITSRPMTTPRAVPSRPHLAKASGMSSRTEMASMVPPAKDSISPMTLPRGAKATPMAEPMTGPATATASTSNSRSSTGPSSFFSQPPYAAGGNVTRHAACSGVGTSSKIFTAIAYADVPGEIPAVQMAAKNPLWTVGGFCLCRERGVIDQRGGPGAAGGNRGGVPARGRGHPP